MKVYGQLEKAQLEVLSSAPTALSTGLIYFDTVSATVKVYNGSGFTTLSASSSGGGGGGISWTNESANAAFFTTENNLGVYKFDSGANQVIKTSALVPSNFVTGTAVSLYLGLYSSGTSGSFTMSVTTYLIKAGTSTIDSTALATSPSTSTTSNTLANRLLRIQLSLSDSSGAISGTSIVAGDILNIVLTRTDSSDPGVVSVLATGTEVKFS